MKKKKIVTWKAKLRISEFESTGKMVKVSPDLLENEVRDVIESELMQGAVYGNIWVGYSGDYGDIPALAWEVQIKVKDDGIPVHFYDLKAKVRKRILENLARMITNNGRYTIKGYEKSRKAMRNLVKDEYGVQAKRISKGRTVEDEIDLIYVP